MPYEEAKKVVNALGLKSWEDWQRWSRTERPPDIPGNPWVKYKNAGWNGYADWLGKSKRPAFCPMKKRSGQCVRLRIVALARGDKVTTLDLAEHSASNYLTGSASQAIQYPRLPWTGEMRNVYRIGNANMKKTKREVVGGESKEALLYYY